MKSTENNTLTVERVDFFTDNAQSFTVLDEITEPLWLVFTVFGMKRKKDVRS